MWFTDPVGYSSLIAQDEDRAMVGDEAKSALEGDVVAAWRDYEVGEGMEIDQRLVFGTAVR